MDGDAQEEVVRHLRAVAELGHLAGGVEAPHQPFGHPVDAALGESGQQGGRRRGRGWDGGAEGHDEGDLALLPLPALHQVVVHEQGGLAGGRRALERRGGDAHDHPSAPEVGQDVAETEGAGHRVELVATFDQPRRGVRVQVGTEGDHQDVGVEGAGIGLDPLGARVDRGHGRLDEGHARLDEIGLDR